MACLCLKCPVVCLLFICTIKYTAYGYEVRLGTPEDPSTSVDESEDNIMIYDFDENQVKSNTSDFVDYILQETMPGVENLISIPLVKDDELINIYLYNTENSDNDPHLSLQLLNSKLSNLHKRQTNQTSISDNRTNQKIPDPPLSTTPSVTKSVVSINKTVSTNETNTNATNSTSGVLNHNLGENGAGIRKYYNTTASLPTISSTVKPNDHLIVVKKNQTDGDNDDGSITKFVNEEGTTFFNKTLESNNINETRIDGHVYYNSSFTIDSATGNHYWVNMENRSDVIVNDLLSNSYRRAKTIKLSFNFPFYGHLIQSITIATGGFIYTGEYVHSWLAATQYIAPLMANFGTSLSNISYIKYIDNGTSFTVQWERVSLQDRPNDGEFTFQTTLFQNGDIVFVYKTVPLIIENILDDVHPVKVGLSDAYIIDRTIYYVRRKTIYEYHRVQFNKEDIKNSTVIYLKALPTCLDHKDCDSCLKKQIDHFQCTWCWQINRCSNGLDRHRQDWLMKGCDRKQITNESLCYLPPTDDHDSDGHEFYYGSNEGPTIPIPPHKSTNSSEDKSLINRTIPNKQDTLSNTLQAPRIATESRVPVNQSVAMSATGILTLLFLIAFVAGLGIWVVYAYRNPHTTSGQILIRYRPSQWRWKRGEARYTAATIHM